MSQIRRTMMVALVVAGTVLGITSPAHAAGPYFPANPPPQYVEPGPDQFGTFPLPGLYLGFTEPGQPPNPTGEIFTSDDIPDDIADPAMSPPKANGELDSYIEFGVKTHDPENPFVGIATALVTLCATRAPLEPVCFTYTFLLYVGVPLPAAGIDNTMQVGVAAGLAVLGVGLVMLSRRRRLVLL